MTRLFIGSKGNKVESSQVTALFLLATLVSCLGNIYYIQYQTYVLVAEIIIGAVSLVTGALEFLLASFVAIEFKSLENSQ